jgi:hypothetical protein
MLLLLAINSDEVEIYYPTNLVDKCSEDIINHKIKLLLCL